jgi:hypothetical protein
MKRDRPQNLPGPSCVVKVGSGRGFVLKCRQTLVGRKGSPTVFVERSSIVTAAHCLPKFD